MTQISGNTFAVKDELKALGGQWNAAAKSWDVPDDKAAAARQIVDQAPGWPGKGKQSTPLPDEKFTAPQSKKGRKAESQKAGNEQRATSDGVLTLQGDAAVDALRVMATVVEGLRVLALYIGGNAK